MSSDKLYLPGLNGIRAVAALTVLFGHMWAPFGNWGVSPSWHIPWPSGPVTTFFVISGFLITYLLMNEIGKTNDVSIPKFYMRRILRIWPLYYAYLALAIVAVWIFHDEINNAAWFYTFFSGNISHAIGLGIILVHYKISRVYFPRERSHISHFRCYAVWLYDVGGDGSNYVLSQNTMVYQTLLQ